MSLDGWRAAQKLYLWGNFPDEEENELPKQGPTLVRNIYCAEVVVQISCGWKHLMVLTEAGTALGMGSNRYGQLGANHVLQLRSLSRVPVPTACTIKQVACGAYHSVLVDDSRAAYGCGEGKYGAVGHGSQTNCFEMVRVGVGIRKVACGARHTIGINEHGRAYGWGDSSHGQLGLTDKSSQLYLNPTFLGECQISDAVCTQNTTLMLREGMVFGCGGNHLGQLGLGHKRPVLTVTPIPLPDGVLRVWAGNYSICLTKRKDVYFFGSGVFGELLLPVKVDLDRAQEIFSGDNYGFAQTAEGRFIGWGSNLNGELLEPPEITGRFAPAEIPFLKHFSKVYCSKGFAVGLSNGYANKCADHSLDSTIVSAEESNEVAALKHENSQLKEKVRELSHRCREAHSSQKDVLELRQQLQELSGKHAELTAVKQALQQQLDSLKYLHSRTHQESAALYGALTSAKAQLAEQKGLEFGQAEQLIQIYQGQTSKSKLETADMKHLLLKAELECNRLMDILSTSDFMKELFDAQPRKNPIPECSSAKPGVLFQSLKGHAIKLRGILTSLSFC